jgi:hypothetical protein
MRIVGYYKYMWFSTAVISDCKIVRDDAKVMVITDEVFFCLLLLNEPLASTNFLSLFYFGDVFVTLLMYLVFSLSCKVPLCFHFVLSCCHKKSSF